MDSKSIDLTAEKLAQLRALFPEVFSEDKVDFDRLKDILGEHVAFPNEHYELSWAGKAEARREIQKQTTATLTPADSPLLPGEGPGVRSGNLFIEGENLEVLRILQKSYFGRIKMIYIDPPYNTGNDSFVYPDDYAERLDTYNKRAGITDEAGYLNKQNLWRKNSRDNGQFHSVWLSMMYPRLYLARNLLREDGVIFVSIDDNEASNIKLLMDEVFGEENFIEKFVWRSRLGKGSTSKETARLHEYVVCYCKNSEFLTFKSDERVAEKETKERIRQWGQGDSRADRPTMYYPVISEEFGEVYPIKPDGTEGRWRTSRAGFEKLQKAGLVVFEKQSDGRIEAYRLIPKGTTTETAQGSIFDSAKVKTTAHGSKELSELFNGKIFDYPKPTTLIKHLIEILVDREALILDFFAGSGTTAQAVLELNEEDGGNRKFICVQLPEPLEETSEAYKAGYRTIADICKARIQKVIEKLGAARAKELPLEAKQPLGFQSFELAPSNFKAWRGDVQGEELMKQLEIFRQREKDGSAEENMLYELLLKSGLPLTAKIETVKVGRQNVYLVEDGKLLVFFKAYHKDVREFIGEIPMRHVVCLDSAFKGKDEDLSNFKLELKEAGIELTII